MCGFHPTRRELLAAGAGAAVALAVGPPASAADAVAAAEVMPGLRIMPRASWGSDLPPKSHFDRDDPRVLLVHHSESPNVAGSGRDTIRAVYAWHTSAAKGWADVCYHFFVARDGTVWEGRAGSLAGPVVADATGGNQGFAQLVCLLGSYTGERPPAAMRASLVRVLAWLADRYAIATADDSQVAFVSRGSNRWKAGEVVTSRTIAGHRDMSYTDCPGDAFYPTIPGLYPDVRAQRSAWTGTLRTAVRLGTLRSAAP